MRSAPSRRPGHDRPQGGGDPGKQDRYPFPRLLTRLVEILPPTIDVLWQVGATVIGKMPAGARYQVPSAELRQAMREADVVIAHAGVGSALAAMQAGRRALVVPRRRAHSGASTTTRSAWPAS